MNTQNSATDTTLGATKSIVTCDLEGRIETFSSGAAEIFGYSPEEVIRKKRVSLFSPGLVVLQHVPQWLKLASETGKYEGRSIFIRKNGTRFPAQIKITPTFKNGKQIGYCGISTPLPESEAHTATPQISLATRVFSTLVITRAPFLSVTLLPIILTKLYVARTLPQHSAEWGLFSLIALAGIFLHLAANTLNDYYDWKAGTDQANSEYFSPFSGGSRSIELGLISHAGLYQLSWTLLGISAALGLFIFQIRGPLILLYGAVGALIALFYTAPPIRLAARRGLGELSVGLGFGPLMTAGAFTALTGEISGSAFALGLPLGLLTTAILYINQFPDTASDELTGKNNVVVTLGKKKARWGYVLLILGAYASIPYLIHAHSIAPLTACTLFSIPLAIRSTLGLFKNFEKRELVRFNQATIQLHMIFGILMVLGMYFG